MGSWHCPWRAVHVRAVRSAAVFLLFGFGVWGVVLGFGVYGLGLWVVMMAKGAEIKKDSCCHLEPIRGIMQDACFHSSRARDMGSVFGARLCSKLRLGCKVMVVLRLSWIQVGFQFKRARVQILEGCSSPEEAQP